MYLIMNIQKHIISKDDSIYEAWPDVVLTKNGKLICIFSECTHHLERNNCRIMICESTDKGRSWSKKRPFTETMNSDLYYNCARISKLSDDSLVIVCDKIAKDEFFGDMSVYIWKGDAEGENWSKAIKTPAIGIVPDKIHELKCGRWLLAAHKYNPVTQKLEQYLWYSEDKGETWSDRVVIAADERYNLCEVSILEMPDETLIAFMRENSNFGCDCLKAISHDHGSTWEGVFNMPIPACHRPVAGFLKDGRVMITYRFIQGGNPEWGNLSQNVFAGITDVSSAASTDRQKQSVRIIPLDYDRNPRADIGYTGWVQFDNGEIYIVNYLVDDSPNGQIRGYSFNPSDITI